MISDKRDKIIEGSGEEPLAYAPPTQTKFVQN